MCGGNPEETVCLESASLLVFPDYLVCYELIEKYKFHCLRPKTIALLLSTTLTSFSHYSY